MTQVTLEVDTFVAIDRLIREGLLSDCEDFYPDDKIAQAMGVFVSRALRDGK